MERKSRIRVIALLSIGAAIALAGCGGGGSASDGAPGGGSVSGAVVKGPVSGSTVTAHRVRADGAIGAMLGSTTSGSGGEFTLSLGDYAGPLLLRTTGGRYTDEATGAPMTMGVGDTMAVAIPMVNAGATVRGVQMTPLTSMAEAMAEHMAGGLGTANIASANSAVGAYFMVDDVVHTPPMNPLAPGSEAGATSAMRNYGIAIAAMSQFAKNVGMSFSSAMVTDLVADASDGVMDGMAGGHPIAMGGGAMGGGMMPVGAGTVGIAGAMSDFIASGFNVSGVTAADMTALMHQLQGSDGHMMH